MQTGTLPFVAIEWGLGALRQRVNELRNEAKALEFLKQCDGLPSETSIAYQSMIEEIKSLDRALRHLEQSIEMQSRTDQQFLPPAVVEAVHRNRARPSRQR